MGRAKYVCMRVDTEVVKSPISWLNTIYHNTHSICSLYLAFQHQLNKKLNVPKYLPDEKDNLHTAPKAPRCRVVTNTSASTTARTMKDIRGDREAGLT